MHIGAMLRTTDRHLSDDDPRDEVVMHRIFLSFCAVGLVVQCIAVVWVWVRNGEITYKRPRELFGAPKEGIRRADTPVWYWSNLVAAILIHVVFLMFFLSLIFPRPGF
jgi:hypothetical protein